MLSNHTGRLMVRLSFSRVSHRMRSKAPRHGGAKVGFIEWLWTVRA